MTTSTPVPRSAQAGRGPRPSGPVLPYGPALVMALALAITACSRTDDAGAPSSADLGGAPPPEGETMRVTEVIDGDTVRAGGESVRLIGVNTPERGDPYYQEASDFTRDLAEGEDLVFVQDVQERDQYGRLLAYLYLPDGRMLNEELLRAGFAQAYTIPPNVRHTEDFLAAEREARDAGAGLWRRSASALRLGEILANAPGPDEENVNGEWAEVVNQGDVPARLDGITLSDESNNVYAFPGLELAPGDAVRVFSGQGRDEGRQLYWGRDMPVWNNGGDHAFLRDAEGSLIDDRAVEGR